MSSPSVVIHQRPVIRSQLQTSTSLVPDPTSPVDNSTSLQVGVALWVRTHWLVIVQGPVPMEGFFSTSDRRYWVVGRYYDIICTCPSGVLFFFRQLGMFIQVEIRKLTVICVLGRLHTRIHGDRTSVSVNEGVCRSAKRALRRKASIDFLTFHENPDL